MKELRKKVSNKVADRINDLLLLDPFSAIRIITPKEFMEHF